MHRQELIQKWLLQIASDITKWEVSLVQSALGTTDIIIFYGFWSEKSEIVAML